MLLYIHHHQGYVALNVLEGNSFCADWISRLVIFIFQACAEGTQGMCQTLCSHNSEDIVDADLLGCDTMNLHMASQPIRPTSTSSPL
jgi:hypothetical protein